MAIARASALDVMDFSYKDRANCSMNLNRIHCNFTIPSLLHHASPLFLPTVQPVAKQRVEHPSWRLPVEKGTNPIPVLRILVLAAVGVALCVLAYYAPAFFIKEDKPSDSPHLHTGGTSVVAIIIDNRWRNLYRQEKGIEIDYENTGSTNAIRQMIDGKYEIAFTHSPLTEVQRAEARGKGGEVLHIPVILCAVVPIYNVKELNDKPPLKFTGEVLADIFRGKIERWNDPALKKLNEGVDLPETKIAVVHREDSSGTTHIFTDYLSEVSEPWRKEVSAGNEVKWPVGTGKARNQKLRNYVQQTEGTIGYVDLLHVMPGDIAYGAVQNKDKTAFIQAKAPNMTAAVQAVINDIPSDLTFPLTNKPGKESYPISGVIWAVCYEAQPASSRNKVADFLHWATHDGQRYAANMSYAPLPEELVHRVEQKLQPLAVTP
jgi:phosphate transport system substrate-binding protein